MKKILTIILSFLTIFMYSCASTPAVLRANNTVWGISSRPTSEVSTYSIAVKELEESDKNSLYFVGYYFDKAEENIAGESDVADENVIVGTYKTSITTAENGYLIQNDYSIEGVFKDKDDNIIGEKFSDSYNATLNFRYDNGDVVIIKSTKEYKVHSVIRNGGKLELAKYHFKITADYEQKKAVFTLENLGDDSYTKVEYTKDTTVKLSGLTLDDEIVGYMMRSFSANENFTSKNISPNKYTLIEKPTLTKYTMNFSVGEGEITVNEINQQVGDYQSTTQISTRKVYVVTNYLASSKQGDVTVYSILKNDNINDLQMFPGITHNFARIYKIENGRFVYTLVDYQNNSEGFANS